MTVARGLFVMAAIGAAMAIALACSGGPVGAAGPDDAGPPPKCHVDASFLGDACAPRGARCGPSGGTCVTFVDFDPPIAEPRCVDTLAVGALPNILDCPTGYRCQTDGLGTTSCSPPK